MAADFVLEDASARVVDVAADFPELFGGNVGAPVGGAPPKSQLDGPAFFPKLIAWGAANSVPPEWMLTVFYLESRLNPHIGNALGYVGLNQLASAYLRAQFGVDPVDYLTWQASQQLEKVVGPWYGKAIKQFLGRPPRSPGAVYGINIAPARIQSQGDGPNAVMYSSPSREYQANAGLDVNHDGVITVGDFDAFMDKLTTQAPYKAALAELRTYQTPATSSGASASSIGAGWGTALAAVAVAMLFGGAAIVIHKNKVERAA